MTHLVENMKVCHAIEPQLDLDDTNGQGVDLRNAHDLFAVIYFNQAGAGVGDGLNIIPQRNDDEDTGWIVLANTVRIWANQALDTNDVLVRQPDAVNYDADDDPAGNKLVVIQVDPRALGNHTAGDNLPCTRFRIRLDGEAGDAGSVLYFLTPTRYQQSDVPEARV